MHLPGGMSLIVVMAIVLLVMGPDKMPEVARTLAKAMNEFRSLMRDASQHLDFTSHLSSSVNETRVYPSTALRPGDNSRGTQDAMPNYPVDSQYHDAHYHDSHAYTSSSGTGQEPVGSADPSGGAGSNQSMLIG